MLGKRGVAILGVSLVSLLSCKTAGFRRSYMALDASGDRQRTTFYVDTNTIYCIGEVTSGRADVTVRATIRSTARYDLASNQMVPVSEVYATAEDAPGKTDLTLAAFLVPKLPGEDPNAPPPQGLPYVAGEYACDLSIDAEDTQSVAFTIAYPTCPAIPVVAGATCTGWVLPNSRCPAQTPGQSCVCDANSGVWECQ